MTEGLFVNMSARILTADDFGLATPSVNSLSSYARQSIVTMIANQQIDSIITERDLADRLGTSRTPVREALQRLEGEGLVVKTGRRSYAVQRLSLRTLIHSLHMRELLETKAAASAAKHVLLEDIVALRSKMEFLWTETTPLEALWRLDAALHILILDHCRNGVVADFVRWQHLLGWLAHMRGERRSPHKRVMASKAEHLAILDALARRDVDAAGKSMRTHIRNIIRHEIGEML